MNNSENTIPELPYKALIRLTFFLFKKKKFPRPQAKKTFKEALGKGTLLKGGNKVSVSLE